MALKPIRPLKYFDDKIAKEIVNWEWRWYYKPILDVLNPKEVLNDNNLINDAIKAGTLYYQNGGFYSKSGRFSNAIAKELEKIGARYSKYGRCYRLAKEKLPENLLWIIETTNAKVYADVIAIKQLMDNALGSIEEALKNLKLADVAEQMILNLEKRVDDNLKANKIETIAPKMTDFRAREFAKNYTENLKFYIKNREPKEIIKMREVVGQMALDGESRVTITNYIKQRFKVEQHYAKFLARNESSIALTEYLSAKYREEGFTYFKWVYTYAAKEPREYHKRQWDGVSGLQDGHPNGLNGFIFNIDNPPVIVEAEGKTPEQRGLPGETYNCHCTFIPVISKTQLINRKLTSRS